MADSRVLSIDIETYGICAQTHDRRPLPSQTLFHPLKSLWHDRAPLPDLIQTCAITTCKGPSGLWDASLCAELEPQDTMVLNMWDPIHVRILAHNLRYAHTLIGMNLPFDLKMLRRFNPLLRAAIPHRRHFLLDLSIFNYLDNESRPERSLKDIGPLLRLFLYDRTAKNTVFSSPYDALSYNAQDSHNTVLALAEFARRIIRNHWKGPSDRGIDKASTYSLSFYNRVLWTCIRLAESGIAVSHRKLTRLNNRLLRIASETTKHVSSAILSSCRTSFYSSFATPEHKPVDGKPQPPSPKSKRKLPPLPPELAKPIFPRLSDAFKAQGRTLRWNSITVRFFATLHPAAILRDRKLILSTEDHLRMIYSVLSGHSAPISTPNLIPPRILK